MEEVGEERKRLGRIVSDLGRGYEQWTADEPY